MHGPGFNWERFIFSSTGELILTKPFTPARALPKFWGGKIWTKFLFCEPRKYINQIFLVFWALLLKIQSVITASISRVRRSFLNSWDISSTSFGITPIETQKRKYKNLDPKQTVHKSQKHYPAPCIKPPPLNRNGSSSASTLMAWRSLSVSLGCWDVTWSRQRHRVNELLQSGMTGEICFHSF